MKLGIKAGLWILVEIDRFWVQNKIGRVSDPRPVLGPTQYDCQNKMLDILTFFYNFFYTLINALKWFAS